MGVPVPNGGTIVDCDDVPLTWTGAEKVCLRSYSGDLTSKTYFANGYCSLVALKCEGNSLICASATMGDFDVMATCPKGTALISSVQEVTMGSSQATIHNKTCAVICDQAADCRTGEIDPVFGSAATQYQCLDKDGIRFCFDPRNLPDDFDVQGF